MPARDERDYFEAIYKVVGQIPRGKVASYGDIAAIVGDGCDAKIVGYALGALGPRSMEVPWQRVIGRKKNKGHITTSGLHQREKLEAEGIEVDEHLDISLERFRWQGPSAEWAKSHGFQMLPPDEPSEQVPDSQLRLF
ncbi:MAG TPA: MGMT family protein [Myxococcaceae bacterium]|jgi:methylated-DNA-protein-cysteine methyltransferase-like protein